ncbi:hypothetical protein [Gordonia hydrophobica]|uniref:Uncharacterized protein n=1 Tax=Gordonia hydrophobica TaxID=40516 RepID=A0ABZ2U7Q9_9ACTN|nr:hypothetical protein [Gordonia hydrophobica]MBM7365362.1 hypothetical protein [Gordonia hydrophobica]
MRSDETARSRNAVSSSFSRLRTVAARGGLIAVVGSAGLCGVGLGVGDAGASPFVPGGRDARSAPVPSIAYGPACAGQVVAFAHAPAERPGVVRFGPTGQFFGISGTGRPCAVTVTIHWRNLATGRHGAVSGPASGNLPGLGENQSGFSREVRTGSGVVRFTVTTDRPHLRQPATTIRAY